MPQAIWTGTISFGLVSIPVRLHPATRPKDVRFHLYDRSTGRRVRLERVVREEEQPRFAPEPRELGGLASPSASGERLSEVLGRIAAYAPASRAAVADEIVRGYELPGGDVVTVEDEELEGLRPERSRTIDIEEFVDIADIDPVYFEKSYYLAPGRDTGAEKPYALLMRAMRSAGQVAIGRFVLRTRPHLVAIRALDNVLALETLYFADEVREPQELTLGAVDVTEAEVATARQLIAALATDWVPEKHGDAYREQLLAMLRGKAPEAAAPEAEPAGAPIDDLMAALKASVEAAKKRASDYPARTRRSG